MHILLIRFSSMGDIVLQTATINWLRALYGRSLRLSFVTSQEFASLISTHPGLDSVITFNRRGGERWDQFIDKLDALNNEFPIDLILDLHGTLRSWRLRMSFWTTPSIAVDKRRMERFLLTKLKGVWPKRLISSTVFGLEPQVERIINDLESIFFDTRGVRRAQDYRKGTHQEMTSLAKLSDYKIPGKYVVLAPSASFQSKRWPISYFVALADKILERTNLYVVILAGPEDKFCDAFNEIKSERLLNLQGKTTLKESMSVLAGSFFCIGNDSGMNHIAEAYEVPVLTIFGPTDPKFGFSPHGSRSRFLSKELWCKPCSTTGKSPCYRERHFCMEDITVDEVFTTFTEMGNL
jgi:heptosyltransferase II